jgi:hypothetical protein
MLGLITSKVSQNESNNCIHLSISAAPFRYLVLVATTIGDGAASSTLPNLIIFITVWLKLTKGK